MEKEWFEDWFDSPYYHILYRDRDETEADCFVQELLNYLKPDKNCKILDLACGKGRHSLSIAKRGFRVNGLDISPNSIDFAKQFENSQLSFFVHDMRQPIAVNQYDLILNLFTSFGYFNDVRENQKALKNMALALRPGGQLLIDYLNPFWVKKNLCAAQTIEKEGIVFQIQKKIYDNRIIKEIKFKDKGKDWSYAEKVQLISPEQMEQLLTQSGFQHLKFFGNYQLEPFQKETSNRLIVLAERAPH